MTRFGMTRLTARTARTAAGPGVFLALLATLAVLLPRWRRHARAQAGSVLEAPPLDPAATARLDADLARFD